MPPLSFMDWRIKKINRLESKKTELENSIFMSNNFDDMFDMKRRVDELQEKIDKLERELEKENE